MRGSARRRSRGSWELTVNLGRDAGGNGYASSGRWGTKAEAERVLNGMLLEAEMGGKELSPRLLLGDFMQRWLKERVYPRLRSQTCRWYERTVRLYLLPELGWRLVWRPGEFPPACFIIAVGCCRWW